MPDGTSSSGPKGLRANVLELVKRRLGLGEMDLLDECKVEFEYGFVAAQLMQQWPCMGDPDKLEFPDLSYFEQAAGLIVAARLFGPLTTGVGGILVKQQSADGDSETYAPPPAASPQVWLAEAQDAIRLLSCVQRASIAAAAGFKLFQMGSRRGVRGSAPCSPSGEYGLTRLLDYDRYPTR